MVSHPRRHFFIPDTQIRPGVRTDHIDWIAQALVDHLPDVVIVGGDWWDFPSLNSHDAPGSASLENSRYKDDLDCGNEAFERLCAPMIAETARRRDGHRKRWDPRRIFLTGNHENRADRFAAANPKWSGVVGSHNCLTGDFERHAFLERVWVDGIVYAHYFQASHSNQPISGTVDARLNKIGASFVQGHEQGFRYGNRITGAGRTWHGLVAGSCYTHIEDFRGAQGQQHWRGVVVLNEIRDGDFCIMPLTLDCLCRRYEGTSLKSYMTKNYPGQSWGHLE